MTRHSRLGFECCERRQMMAGADHMQIGMNLENVVDWSPAWTFTDAFKASRPWIAHEVNTTTWESTWDVGATNPIRVDANGNVTGLSTRVNGSGQTIQQMAGTLMFRGLDGGYPAGTYRAEWDGTGRVTFGFDASTTATGRTAAGRNYADLAVTPGSDGIFMRIEETSPADPVRNFNLWMPAWNGQSFVGQRWQPGAAFSPYHPLFLQRLEPFGVIRFMAPQETNTSDIGTWADRRDADDIRQGSGPQRSPGEPLVNGMSVEYMVQLANDLDADPWFNMPHMADDEFVRNFATYVRDHLEAGRKAYVEWSNEIWNFGAGFEASTWVRERTRLPQYAGLDNWQVAGLEAKRDMDIWSSVFAGRADRLVRVAGGWAANDWVTDRIVESMGGSFDAIAIAPYFSPNDDQRGSYTSATTAATVLADSRTAIAGSVGWVRAHRALADEWTTRLGRDIRLVAYEGGPHLDGRDAPYQNAFYAAVNDPRMGDLYRDYLKALDAEGMDLYVDFVYTGQAGASAWGDFAKLHRMDEPLSGAHRYNAVVAAADGSLWGGTPAAAAVVSVATIDGAAAEAGRDPATIRFTRSGGDLTSPLTVAYTVGGMGTPDADYDRLTGSLTFAAGASTADVVIRPIDDAAVEPSESVVVTLTSGPGYTAGAVTRAEVTITSDDPTAAEVNAAYVRLLYANFLNRTGDVSNASDAGAWVTLLGNGVSRLQVAERILRSSEGLGVQVAGLYRTVLGREVEAVGRQNWVSYLQQGGTTEQLTILLVTSPEYRSRFAGSDAQYVQSLYVRFLLRSADDAGLTTWQAQVAVVGRAEVARRFLASAEFRGNLVRGLYVSLLRRASSPSQREVDAWGASGIDSLGMQPRFAATNEFVQNGSS
jgi:hypothetical protein